MLLKIIGSLVWGLPILGYCAPSFLGCMKHPRSVMEIYSQQSLTPDASIYSCLFFMGCRFGPYLEGLRSFPWIYAQWLFMAGIRGSYEVIGKKHKSALYKTRTITLHSLSSPRFLWGSPQVFTILPVPHQIFLLFFFLMSFLAYSTKNETSDYLGVNPVASTHH